jgi:hypothetical protein
LTANEQFGALLVIQDDRCAGCGIEDRTPADVRVGRPLRMDHDHETGLIRGLLCHNCNVQEGKDCGVPHIAAYLANPPAGPFGWMYPGFVHRYAPSRGQMRAVARRLHVPYVAPKVG